MSAFANNPWVKRDKAKAEEQEPEIKRPKKNPRKPGKLSNKNPFGKAEEKSDSKPNKPVTSPHLT
jgi:hypothetical protein